MDPNARFSRDYADARAKFLAASRLLGGRHRAYVNPNRGPAGEELATDTAWFGPEQAQNVVVLVSATHGVEGFCGSARGCASSAATRRSSSCTPSIRTVSPGCAG